MPSSSKLRTSSTKQGYLIVVVVAVQAATCLHRNAAAPPEDVAWLTEAGADAGACAVGGGLLTARDARWAALNVLRVRGTLDCGRKHQIEG